MNFSRVNKLNNKFIIMAFYFPQFHPIPENKLNNKNYTDWDFIKDNNNLSFKPENYYNLCDENIINNQDKFAYDNHIGVFIFYHYWLDNTLIMNLPIDIYIQKNRHTKFMLCWDNETGLLGKQLYDQPEKHAYQLIRYFNSDNYLTDDNGYKPFLIYLSNDVEFIYLENFLNFLKLYNINIKIGVNYQKYKTSWYIPPWADFICEFGPHSHDKSNYSYNYNQNMNYESYNKEYWQGLLSSWDSRPRIMSKRTTQNNNIDFSKSNGAVDPQKFGENFQLLKNNMYINNSNNIISIFAFNEWTEGAVLEKSIQFKDNFINKIF